MFGLQESVGLGQVRGPVTALKEEPLVPGSHAGLTARTWMQPGIVDTTG